MVFGRMPPRWTFSLFWRRALEADLAKSQSHRRGGPVNRRKETAAALLGAIASEPGQPDHVAPAYEDPAEWLVKEVNRRRTSRRRIRNHDPRSATASPAFFRAG
jgi:uncharacterized protein (DUF2126 family)